MKDEACSRFLQWALPKLHMRWSGFRRVYGQVCKRLRRRLRILRLDALDDYRHYLATHQQEWQVLDSLCQVTISRFYRDKMMFAFLAEKVLPVLARQAMAEAKDKLTVWSVGCGSGEEPYTVNLVWQFQLQAQFPSLTIRIIANDANADMRQRFEQACYAYSTIKNLPSGWREQAFTQEQENYCLKPEYRGDTRFIQQDIRKEVVDESFDLILCRNLVFTYYDEALQREILARMQQVLKPGGALVIGIHEQLPAGEYRFETWSDKLRIYRKIK
jgi:chemotaxis protein methyltransferase CheR